MAVILDAERFLERERPAWRELETMLETLAARGQRRLSGEEASRLRDLYHRVAAGLARARHGLPPGEVREYLEALAGRAYAEIYGEYRGVKLPRGRVWLGFFRRLPWVFRRHGGAFALALSLTLAGGALGALAVTLDPAAAAVLLPAAYLRDPAQRVAQAQQAAPVPLPAEAAFSAALISHNIRISMFVFALGVTFGIGTGLLLFGNGVLLGAVAAQYTRLGFGAFAAGWLLPHGAFEIPSVLIAGQAGFVLAGALVRGGREPRAERLRGLLPELLTLLGGLCCLLLWAGLVESFFSQRMAPAVPDSAKIALGMAEMVLLACYLLFTGRGPELPSAPVGGGGGA